MTTRARSRTSRLAVALFLVVGAGCGGKSQPAAPSGAGANSQSAAPSGAGARGLVQPAAIRDTAFPSVDAAVAAYLAPVADTDEAARHRHRVAGKWLRGQGEAAATALLPHLKDAPDGGWSDAQLELANLIADTAPAAVATAALPLATAARDRHKAFIDKQVRADAVAAGLGAGGPVRNFDPGFRGSRHAEVANRLQAATAAAAGDGTRHYPGLLGSPSCVSVDPTGKYWATLETTAGDPNDPKKGPRQVLVLLDATTGKPVMAAERPDWCEHPTFRPDGGAVLTGEGKTASVTELKMGAAATVVARCADNFLLLKGIWSPDGKRILAQSDVGKASVSDVATGQPIATFGPGTPPESYNRPAVGSGCFALDGQAVFAQIGNSIWKCDIGSGVGEVCPFNHDKSGKELHFKHVASVAGGKTILVVTAVKQRHSEVEYGDGYTRLLDADTYYYYATQWDAVTLKQVAPPRPIFTNPDQADKVGESDFAVTADGKKLASVIGRQFSVWDISALQKPLATRTLPRSWRHMAFSADGKSVVAVDGTRITVVPVP